MRIRNARRSDFTRITNISRSLYEGYGDPDFPVTPESSIAMLERFMTTMPFFKVLEIDDEIVAWVAAHGSHDQHHSLVKGITVVYYHSMLSGIKAVKALNFVHEAVFAYAEKHMYEIVITSSYLPTREAFNKILAKAGWREHHGVMKRRTRWHQFGPETARGEQNSPSGTPTMQRPRRVPTVSMREAPISSD